jgi:hypothetical protein
MVRWGILADEANAAHRQPLDPLVARSCRRVGS